MNRDDVDYAAFLDRLPILRRLHFYVRKVHHFQVTTGHGHTLINVAGRYADCATVRGANRQTLKRIVALADHMHGGLAPDEAVRQAWLDYPDPVAGRPARPDWVQGE